MGLDSQAEALLRRLAERGMRPSEQMSVLEGRESALVFKELEGEAEPVAEIRDLLVSGASGELPTRLYIPEDLGRSGPLPLLVYFHGGGWIRANVEVADKPCRSLANASGCLVASVEYRLSPENKFPAAAEDCYAATGWLAAHAGELGADPTRIAVGGDSAGGNLTTAVTLMARDRGTPSLAYQLLIYPVTDAGGDYTSREENAEGYFLTAKAMEWYWKKYLREEADAENPYASPMYATDLSGLPPALLITCEYDPLRDEGEAYGKRLEESGVEVKFSRYDGMIHGFLWMGGVVDRTHDLVDEIGKELRTALLP